MERWCRRCHCDHSIDQFGPSKNSKDGISYRCRSPYSRDVTRKAPEPPVNHRHYLKQYGLTGAEFNAMLAAQDGVCAICKNGHSPGKSGKTRALHVDHDHVTQRVRGLLCHQCNIALGMIGDSIPRAIAIANYLVNCDNWPKPRY